MKLNSQKGFSLIEMLVVVVIIGIIAAIGIPLFRKAKYAAENGAIFATTRILSQEQMSFFSQNSRYARLDEINAGRDNSLGTTSGNTILRGNFTFAMSPPTPANSDLNQDFTIIATKTTDAAEVPYQISVSASGEIVQIIP